MVSTLIDELIKYQAIDLNKLVLKIYPRLNLLPQEAVMLIHLLSTYQQNNQKCFALSYAQLRNKTGVDKKENGLLIKALEDKQFIEIYLEKNKNDKEQETVDINKALIKIEEFLKKEKEDDLNKQIQLQLKDVISFFEIELGRTLSPNEISLLDEYKTLYSKTDYEKAVIEVSKKKKISIKNSIDYLKTNAFINQKVNEEDERTIQAFFESINK